MNAEYFVLKEDLYKTIKNIKIMEFPGSNYPAASMTAPQMRKHTATVKCGYGDRSYDVALFVFTHEEFKAFLDRTGATAKIVQHLDAVGRLVDYLIRINYSPTRRNLP